MNTFNYYFAVTKGSAHIGYLASGIYDAMGFLSNVEHFDLAADAHALIFTIYAVLVIGEKVVGSRRGKSE